MELKDTAAWMCSPDYQERFKAEYFQLKTRLEKLESMLKRWDTGELDFDPICSRHLYDGQVNAMRWYMTVLETRAGIEKIDLSGEG